MKHLWSIYLAPSEVVEGTEVFDMLQRFPTPANHDATNYIFVATHPGAVNPITVSDFEYEDIDQLVALIAKELFATDRSRAIHLSKSEASMLHKHPAWKLWCGNYTDQEDPKAALEADHEAVFKVGVDRRKGIDTLVEQSKAELKAAFGA